MSLSLHVWDRFRRPAKLLTVSAAKDNIRPVLDTAEDTPLGKEGSKMKGFVLAALALTVLMSSVPAQAHHSFNTFWFMDKTMEIQGVVKSFKLVSPHSEMMVEV